MELVFEKSPVARMSACLEAGDRIVAAARELAEQQPENETLRALAQLITTEIAESRSHQEQVKQDLMVLARALPSSTRITVKQRSTPEASAPAANESQPSEATSRPAATAVPKPAYELTDEQQEIVESGERDLVVNAFAGTGKTSTLVAYGAARPRQRGLYLAFNRAIADEAQKKFTRNITCRTSHSLAFAACGRAYSAKLGNLRARDVAEFLKSKMAMPGASVEDEYAYAQMAMNRVRDFFADGSMEDDIRDEDTPGIFTAPSGMQVDGIQVARGARALWGAMKDVDNLAIKMPHDGYLKLWVLSAPSLSQYDFLMVDEAQDSNPALLTLVQQQKIGRILVGDRHQGIYGFRGSINAMGRMRGAKRYAITKSFRFGQEIADVANSVLSVFGGETHKLMGCGSGQLPERPTHAHLHRTNAGLFASAVEYIEDGSGPGVTPGGRGLHFTGGTENYQFDLITDTWRLKAGMMQSISDPFLRRFTKWDQFEKYAEAVEDKELKARIKIVDKFQQRVPDLVARVKASHVDADKAMVELCTAHKSKGLEWSRVEMADDFPEMMSDVNVPRVRRFSGAHVDASELLSTEEANLYYVAATRARCTLTPNKQLDQLLRWCEKFPALALPETEHAVAA